MEKPQSRSFAAQDVLALLGRARIATLATLDRESGAPYASLINLAQDEAGLPLILISRLAWHTRNLMADPRGSILAAEPAPAGDALTGPRATVVGHFHPAEGDALRKLYLARHPEAETYVDFPDFGFWRLAPDRVHAVAGFGRIETFAASEVFRLGSQSGDW